MNLKASAIAATTWLSLFAISHGAAKPSRSVSKTRQFVVYGADARLRGAICDVAERTKENALVLLHEQDRWTTPVVINAELAQANLPELPPARLNFGQTGFGLKIQLDLTIGADVNAPLIERELLRAILLEMMYRAEPNIAAGTAYVDPPEWLLEGALAVAPGRDLAPLAATLATATASGTVMPLEQFLRQKPALLETPSRALYRAYAAALVSLLVEAPDGRTRLARYLADLPHATNDALSELAAHFPALGNDAPALQKTWLANVDRFAARERYRLLNCEETERQLAQILRLQFRARDHLATVFTLEEFDSFKSNPATRDALREMSEQLLLLSGRANPLYRPVVEDYQKIVAQLLRGKAAKLSERLARNRATREQITRRMGAIGDYMNWYEATQAKNVSGAFEQYMKAAEQAADHDRHRRDAISVYLDAMEAQF